MGTSNVENLGKAKYVSVKTFRKDGDGVPTPVWIARDGDQLVLWSVTDAGKVKRVRRNPKVEVTECDIRGHVTGDSVSGTAAVLDGHQTDEVRRLLRSKYGLLGAVAMLGSRLRRGNNGSIGISIRLDA